MVQQQGSASTESAKTYGTSRPPEISVDTDKPAEAVRVGILIDERSPNARKPSGKNLDGYGNRKYDGYDSRHAQAASKIGKVFRGETTRHKVATKYHTEHKTPEEALHPSRLGLGEYAEWNDRMPEVSDDLRYHIRDITAERVLQQLGCPADKIRGIHGFENAAYESLAALTTKQVIMPEFLKKQGEICRLFNYEMPEPPPTKPSDNNPANMAGTGSAKSASSAPAQAEAPVLPPDHVSKKYLLGQYECMAVPARADFNHAFDAIDHPAPVAPPAGSSTSASSSGASATQSAKPGGGQSPNSGGTGGNSTDPLVSGSGAADSQSADCDGPSGFKGWFWVLHEGAPNIGESAQADDFYAYSVEEAEPEPERKDSEEGYEGLQGRGIGPNPARCCWKDRPSGERHRRLNEDMYIESMYHLWRLSLLAFAKLGVNDGILFPFGMGAFLRHLGKNDDRYLDASAMRTLRRRIADALMKAIASLYWPDSAKPGAGGNAAANGKKTPAKQAKDAKGSPIFPERLHLCLVCHHPEGIENHNVFLEAAGEIAKENPEIKKVLQLRRNVDVLHLAHSLASSGPPLKVGLLNGANRKLFGNHWFQSGAKFAIDENLHRRSASMTRVAVMLNMGTEAAERRVGELAHCVQWLGGKVEVLPEKVGNGAVPSNAKSKPTKANNAASNGGGAGAGAGKSAGGGGGGCMCCRRRNPGNDQTAAQSKGAATSTPPSSAQNSASNPQNNSTGGSSAKSKASPPKGKKK